MAPARSARPSRFEAFNICRGSDWLLPQLARAALHYTTWMIAESGSLLEIPALGARKTSLPPPIDARVSQSAKDVAQSSPCSFQLFSLADFASPRRLLPRWLWRRGPLSRRLRPACLNPVCDTSTFTCKARFRLPFYLRLEESPAALRIPCGTPQHLPWGCGSFTTTPVEHSVTATPLFFLSGEDGWGCIPVVADVRLLG